MDNALTEKRLSRERVAVNVSLIVKQALSLPHSSQNENIQSFSLAVLSLPLCFWRHGGQAGEVVPDAFISTARQRQRLQDIL